MHKRNRNRRKATSWEKEEKLSYQKPCSKKKKKPCSYSFTPRALPCSHAERGIRKQAHIHVAIVSSYQDGDKRDERMQIGMEASSRKRGATGR